MNLQKTQITLLVCSLFTGGVASVFLNLTIVYAVLCFVILTFLVIKKYLSYKLSFICIAILGLSIFYTYSKIPEPDYLARIAPAKVSMRGIITSQPAVSTFKKVKFELLVNSIKEKNENWSPIKSKTLVSLYDDRGKFKNIKQGDFIELKGSVKPPFTATNPGEFDYRGYLQNSKIFTLTSAGVRNLKSVEKPEKGYWYFIQKSNEFREKILSIHSKYIKSPKLEILGGIVFGNYVIPTPKDIKQNFINSGLLHILAASGMNVALVSGIWLFISLRLRVPYRVSVIIAAVLILIYSTLTGFSPSITRATWMLEFILIGKLLDRRADTIALLSMVCTLMLLFNPLLITNIGFQLSFAVTFGLLFCTPVLIEKCKPVPQFLSGALIIPVIAQIWATPIQLFHFNSFSMYSVISNILVSPFIGIISFLGFTSSLLSTIPYIGEKICFLADKLTEPLISALLFISNHIAYLPGALQYFATPEIITIVAFYSLIIFTMLYIKTEISRNLLKTVISCILILFMFSIFKDSFNRNLKITVFDVKEADSICIQTPDKKTFIIDTGNTGYKSFNSAKTVLIPYLRDRGINKIDSLILTHPDSDHIGGTVELLNNIKIDRVLDNGEKSNSKVYKEIQKIINTKHTPLKHITNSELLYSKQNMKIFILKDTIHNESSNDKSLIIYITYGNNSALLMGDAESKSLELLKNKINKPVNIIKIGHHGSYDSINDEFIDYIKPQTAIISVGTNKYGHPHNAIIKNLQKNEVNILRTDQDNAIYIEMNDKNINIHPFKPLFDKVNR
jgi:competence protein ComEC